MSRPMASPPRVAVFADSYLEANGVARTMQSLTTYAAARHMPLLVVHAGPETACFDEGTVRHVQLRRGRVSFGLEHDLRFDLALWRHLALVREQLAAFEPELVHVTGPSDVGLMGAAVAVHRRLPMVGSWHTNLHEYAWLRLQPWVQVWPEPMQASSRFWLEHQALALTLQFYRLPNVLLAPNEEWRARLARKLGKPVQVMSRGVDTTTFHPRWRERGDTAVNIGYVGRLSPEKSVRVLGDVARELARYGVKDVRFTVVGEGRERDALQALLPGASFPGTLRGDALARAYADMDLFAFPSETETVGNVVQEAMASGVPVVAMGRGGPRFIADCVDAAVLAATHERFVELTLALVRDPARRRRMAAAARQVALTRSWDAIFDGVYRAYAQAVHLQTLKEETRPKALRKAVNPGVWL